MAPAPREDETDVGHGGPDADEFLRIGEGTWNGPAGLS